ncbi:MAG: hypothetical protein GQ577_02350 [Woeseiaceae bacterium]|jgi:hypothetical protein|nr:hypothetical protein [Woeseiaceae bacterium]
MQETPALAQRLITTSIASSIVCGVFWFVFYLVLDGDLISFDVSMWAVLVAVLVGALACFLIGGAMLCCMFSHCVVPRRAYVALLLGISMFILSYFGMQWWAGENLDFFSTPLYS